MSEINFLPSSFLRQRARRRRAVLHVAAVAMSLVIGVGFWSVERGQTRTMRQSVEALELEAQAVKQQETATAKLMGEYKSLLHQTRVQRELAQPVTQTQVLAVLGQVLPPGVSLTQVDVDATRPEPAPVPPPKVPGQKAEKPRKAERPTEQPQFFTLTLQGLAPDDLTIANVVGLLSDHPLFTEVRLKHSRAMGLNQQTWRQFALTMRVDLNRDVQPPRKEMAHAH